METMTPNKIQKIVIPANNFRLIDSCRADMKDGRETLTFLNIKEDGVIEVTDGRIMVQSKLGLSIPSGVYKIIASEKNSKSTAFLTLELQDAVYPNMESIIPQETEEKLKLRVQKKQIHAGTIVKIYNFNQSIVSEKYLEILGELDTDWSISKTEKNRALLFKSEAYETIVVLMPVAI